jgi:branched-chain amino acid transport system ATP-binding protein
MDCTVTDRRYGGKKSNPGGTRLARDVILATDGLTMEFRGFRAVNGVALQVERGTIHALIGPNGAGKTTCFNLLTKFLIPTSGTIRYKDRDITGLKAAPVISAASAADAS